MSARPSLNDGARPGTRHSFELPVLHEPHRSDGAVDHAAAAARFIADEARTDWHDGALWFVREKRDRAAASVPEWERLRELASAIKEHTLSRLGSRCADGSPPARG